MLRCPGFFARTASVLLAVGPIACSTGGEPAPKAPTPAAGAEHEADAGPARAGPIGTRRPAEPPPTPAEADVVVPPAP